MPLTRIDSEFLDLDAIGGIDFDVQSGVPTFSVDATTHRVGIGTNNPERLLHVRSSGSSVVSNFECDTLSFTSVDLTNTGGSARITSLNNDLLLSPGEVEKLRVTSGGSVGIGTNNPSTTLHVKSSSPAIRVEDNTGSIDITTNTSGDGVIKVNGAGKPLRVFTAGTERLRIDSSGTIKIGGIGQLALDISYDGSSATAAKIVTNTGVTNANSTLTFAVNENSGAQLQLKGDGAAVFSEGSTERMRIDSSGNLGVNVASPNHNLDVYLSGRLNQLGQGGYGLLVGPGSNTGGFTYMSTGDIEISTAQTNKDIVFSDAVGGNERMRLTGDTGRLGIGTDTPGANLDVEGTLLVGTTGVANGNTTINGHLTVDRTGVSGSNPWLTVRSGGSSVFYVNGGGSVFADGSVNATNFTAGTSGTGDGNSSIFGSLTVDRNGVSGSNIWFQVKNGTTPIIYANGQGKVGIGTNNPTNTLEISKVDNHGITLTRPAGGSNPGTVKFEVHSNGAGRLVSERDFNLNFDTDNLGNQNFSVSANGTERLRITSDGKVCIGSASDEDLEFGTDVTTVLQLSHGSAPKIVLCRDDTSVTTNDYLGIIDFHSRDGGIKRVARIGARAGGNHGADDGPTDLVFHTMGDNTATTAEERLRITYAGVHKMTTAGNVVDGTFYATQVINNTGSNTFSRIRFDRNNVAKFGLTLKNDDNFCISNLYKNGSVGADDFAFVMTNTSKIGVGCVPEVDFQVRNGNGGTVKIGGSGSSATGFQITYNNSGTTTTELLTNYRSTNGNASLKIDTGTFIVATGTSGTERVRIDSSGKVGINEASPDRRLHVRNDNAAAAKFGGQGGGEYYIEIGQLASNSSPGFDATGVNAAMRFHLNGSEKMRIANGGNVGIGINAPNDRLHVKDSLNQVATFETTSTADMAIRLKNSQGSMFFGLGGGEGFAVATDSDLNGSNNRFVIRQDGNTGINNVSPPVKFAVADSGDVKMLLSSSWSGTQQILFGGSSNSTGQASSTAAKIICNASAPGGQAVGNLQFDVNGGDDFNHPRLIIYPEGSGNAKTNGGSVLQTRTGTQASNPTHSNPLRIRPDYYSADLGAGFAYIHVGPSSSDSTPVLVWRTRGNPRFAGEIKITAVQRTNSPSNAQFRRINAKYACAMYSEGDNDGSALRHLTEQYNINSGISITGTSITYVATNSSLFGTNSGGWLDYASYFKFNLSGIQGHTLCIKIDLTQGFGYQHEIYFE